MTAITHRAGFVHIIGKPNVGKSTLINGLMEYPLSIATHKPQTTRQNIIGVDQGKDYQIVYIDTPGYFKPSYALQEIMMQHVKRALLGSDLLLWVVDIRDVNEAHTLLQKHTEQRKLQVFLLLNKADLIAQEQLSSYLAHWQKKIPNATHIVPMAAINPQDVRGLKQKITDSLPLHPAYYDKETLTDKPMRFFASNILRKAMLLHYHQEIPYSTEATIDLFQAKEKSLFIKATLYVARASQKGIIIGRKGQALKKMGITARQDLQHFFMKKVFLQQEVKVLPNWRNKKHILAKFGYQ